MELSKYNQGKVDHFRRTFGSEHFMFACQAAVPLIFSTDLLYKMWLNFNTYKVGDKVFKIRHWAVSDLILSSFCDPVGYKMYKLDPELRAYLQQELVASLSMDRKRQLAQFIKQFAERYYASTEKNIREIHLLTAASILDPDGMGDMLEKRLRDVPAGHSDIVNLLSLYFNLSGKTEREEGSKNYINLVAESDPSAPNVFELVLPEFLREKIQMEDPGKAVATKNGSHDALSAVRECIRKQDRSLSLANYGLTDDDFAEGEELNELLSSCNHLEELVLGARESKGIRNTLTKLPTALLSLGQLRVLKALNLGLVDISGLINLFLLEELHLERNEIVGLSSIERLRSLRKLWLNNNLITSIAELRPLDQLRFIDLRRTHVQDLSALYSFFKRDGKLLFDNEDVISPPFDVVSQGNYQIINFMDDLEGRSRAGWLIERCIATKATTLELGNCGLTEESFLPGAALEQLVRKCHHIKALILSNRWWSPKEYRWIESNNTGKPNLFSKIPDVFRNMRLLETVIFAGEEDRKWEITDLSIATSWRSLTYLDISNNQLADTAILKRLVKKDVPLLSAKQDAKMKGIRIYGNPLPEDVSDKSIPTLAIRFDKERYLNFFYNDGDGIRQHVAGILVKEVSFDLTLIASPLNKGPLRSAWQYLVPDECKQLIKEASVIALELDAETMRFPWEMFIDDDDQFIGLNCTFIRKNRYRQFSLGFPANDALVLFVAEGLFSSDVNSLYTGAADIRNVLNKAGLEVAFGGIKRYGLSLRETVLRSFQVIYLSGVHYTMKGSNYTRVTNSYFKTTGIADVIEEIEQMEVPPELVFLDFVGAEVFASRLSQVGIQVITLTSVGISDKISPFPAVFFDSLLVGELPLYHAFKNTQSYMQLNYGEELAIAYQCYGNPEFKLVVKGIDDVSRIVRKLENMLDSEGEETSGYYNQYSYAMQYIDKNPLAGEDTTLVQLLAAVADKLGLFDHAARHRFKLIVLYDKNGNPAEAERSRNAFNRILTENFNSSLEQYIKVASLALRYESIRDEMPVSDERTILMTDVYRQMLDIGKMIIPLIPIFKNSSVAGERLLIIAALQRFPNMEQCEWLADRVGDAESFFVGFQAANALYSAAGKFAKERLPQLLRIVNRAMGNLRLSSNQDENQHKVLNRTLLLLNEGYSTGLQGLKLKLADGISLNALEGLWSGSYIHQGTKTTFSLVLWFYDLNKFTGVVKDGKWPDMADIEGAVEVQQKTVKFSKRYRAANFSTVYYDGKVNSRTEIAGRYKVGDVEGEFEMMRFSAGWIKEDRLES